MPKELKQVRRTKKALYPDTQEYLGKPSFGEATVQLGSEEQDSEEREGRSPVGILGDLPPEIQEYVERSVAMKSQSGAGENGSQPDIQYDENGEIIGEKIEMGVDLATGEDQTVEQIIDNIFDAPFMTPELQEKLSSFKEALDDFRERAQNQTQTAPTESDPRGAPIPNPEYDASIEQEQRGQEQSESSQDSQNDAGQQEQPQGEASCTKAERAFLDAFMALQEGGALLGMIPSTRWLPKIQNIDIGGIRNISILPTVASMNPEDEQEAHSLLRVQADLLFDSCETMLKEHNIK